MSHQIFGYQLRVLNFTINNWKLILNLNMKPPRMLDGHSTKIKKIIEILTKLRRPFKPLGEAT